MYMISGRSRMMSVDLSLHSPLRMDHRLVCAPTNTTHEGGAAAGKPCLRQSCGHDHSSHIRSEGMECSKCECLGFVGFAQPDDSRPTIAESRRGTTNAERTARFERDVIPLRAPLFRRALRLTSNRVDAENLLQDTMLAAYVGFDSFREGTNLNAWLHRILKNKYIDSYRQKQRQPVVYLRADITDELLAVNVAHSSTGQRSAEDEALDTLPTTDIKMAMQALPEQTRLVVYYADVQDLKYRQIAEIMHIPQGTVMSRLHRGRRQLRRLLADVAEYTCTPPTRRARSISCNEAKLVTCLSAPTLTS
jgi:RNA polymerase sigma-70 factor (ECF subfamily)